MAKQILVLPYMRTLLHDKEEGNMILCDKLDGLHCPALCLREKIYILDDPLRHSGKEELQRWRTVRGLQGTKMKVDFGSWRGKVGTDTERQHEAALLW